MPQTVSVSQLSREIRNAADGTRVANTAAVLGLVLVVVVVADATLNVIGRGIPSLSGSLVVSAHAAAAANAVDEAVRLRTHSQPFSGWLVWTIVGLQAILICLGAIFIAISQPRRWLGEWLRPPRGGAQGFAVPACLSAAVALAVALIAIWRRILGHSEFDAGTGWFNSQSFASALTVFGSVVCGVSVVAAAIRTSARIRALIFVGIALGVGGLLTLGAVLAASFVVKDAEYSLLYRPFDAFRAIESMVALPIMVFALVWLSVRWPSIRIAPHFEIEPDPAGTSSRRALSIGLEEGSERPLINVRVSDDAYGEFRMFHIFRTRPASIAVSLERNRWHPLESGSIALVRLQSPNDASVQVSVSLPLGITVNADINVTSEDDDLPTDLGPGYVDANGRPHVDWQMLQRVAAVLAPETPKQRDEQQKVFAEIVRRVIVNAAAAQLIRLEGAQARLQGVLAVGLSNSAASLAEAPIAPRGYGPSPTNLKAGRPQIEQVCRAAANLAELQGQAVEAMRQVLLGQPTASGGTRHSVSRLVERVFFEFATSDVFEDGQAPHSAAAHGVRATLVINTEHGLRSILRIRAEVTAPNLEQQLASVASDAASLRADAQRLLEEVRQGGAAADVEYIRMRQEKALSSMQMFTSPYSVQALNNNPWLKNVMQEWMTSEARTPGVTSSAGDASGQTTPSSTPTKSPGGQGTASVSGSDAKTW
jgi:hypothetical protein